MIKRHAKNATILAMLIALVALAAERDQESREVRRVSEYQAGEIARLNVACPAIEAGERLVSSIRYASGEKHCLYTMNNGYGRAVRQRVAVRVQDS